MLYLNIIEYFIIAFILAHISIQDLREKKIPNGDIVFLILIWTIDFMQKGQGIRAASISLATSFAVSALCLAVAVFFRAVTKKKGLGMGDIKLIFAASLFLNAEDSLYTLFISLIIGLICGIIAQKRRNIEVFAFGPAISAAFVLVSSLDIC